MRYLDILAWIFMLPAGFVGSIVMMHILGMGHAPKKLMLAYLATMGLGIVLLLLYAFFSEEKDKNIDTLVVFAVALGTAGLLFMQHKKHKSFQKWMVFLHAAFSLSGLIWLSIHVLNELK